MAYAGTMVKIYNKAGTSFVLANSGYDYYTVDNPSVTINNVLSEYSNSGIQAVSLTLGGTALDGSSIASNWGIEDDITYLYDVTPGSDPEPTPSYPETIAGQIERLQDAKAAIKTSIESKGVTVGSNDTIDCYAGCIDSISSGGVGGNTGFVELLVVGGGGNGGTNNYNYGGGGGGGGGVIYEKNYPLFSDSCCVVVGARGQDSCFGACKACRGGNGGAFLSAGSTGGSGGGAGPNCNYSRSCAAGSGIPGQGQGGGTSTTSCYAYIAGGGGGGASEIGASGRYSSPGKGGNGFQSDISGTSTWYAGGGGGGGTDRNGCPQNANGGCGGGGNGRGNATYYGGGGGGGSGCGCQGIVIVRYLTNGDCGINCATGGTKYTCGNYTIHCFTSSGTFCIVC